MNKKKKNIINISAFVVVVIVLAAALNIFVTVLNSKLPLAVDLTENQLYELSDKTKSFLESYDTPVDIYILSSSAQQDDRVSEILNRYAALNGNIKITNINTASNPTFGAKYVKDGTSIATNSVIVDSGARYKVYTPTELLSGNSSMLNVENSITASLKYVARDTLPKAYLTTGHGEHGAPSVTGRLQNENYEIGEINTLTDAIPEDASVLISVRPMSDFTSEEISKLDNYLLDGGNIQIYLSVESKQENMANLLSYLKTSWGMGVSNDLAVETNENCTISSGNGMPSLIVPTILSTPFTESIVTNNRVVAHTPYAKVISQEFEYNGSISVTPVLTTSQRGYPSSDETTLKKNEGANLGSYIIAALSEDMVHDSSVYVSGTTMLLTIDAERVQGLANYDYFMNLTEYTVDDSGDFLVDAKPVLGSRIYISDAASKRVMVIVVIVIPLLVLICGIVVWLKRRNL